jgi:ATP/ADP translocase
MQLLLGIGTFAALAGVLVEFQFYVAAAASGNSSRENLAFFATLYLALNAAALVIQLLITARLQRRVGLFGSLLVLPTVLVGLVPLTLSTAAVGARATLRLAEGGLKSSIHRVSWEQSYLLVGPTQRAAAKLLVDGAAARMAEGAAALLLYAWLMFVVRSDDLAQHSSSWLTYLLIVALLAWIALTRRLARTHAGGRRFEENAVPADVRIPDS